MRRFILALVVLAFVAEDADARGQRRRLFRRGRTYNSRTITSGASFSAASPQAMAEQKAAYCARNRFKGHPGGGFGGGNAEGVGWSTYSAQNALDNCCFTGQRVVLGQSVVQGSDGSFYAVKIFR